MIDATLAVLTGAAGLLALCGMWNTGEIARLRRRVIELEARLPAPPASSIEPKNVRVQPAPRHGKRH